MNVDKYLPEELIANYPDWVAASTLTNEGFIIIPDINLIQTSQLIKKTLAISPNFPDLDYLPSQEYPCENTMNSSILIPGKRINLHIDALGVLEGDAFRNEPLISRNYHSVLGSGGFTYVFSGYDNFYEKDVAIKILKPSLYNTIRFWDMIEEAR